MQTHNSSASAPGNPTAKTECVAAQPADGPLVPEPLTIQVSGLSLPKLRLSRYHQEVRVASGDRQKLLHGTLDTLVLRTLSHGPRHGYAIARWLEEHMGDAIQVEEGSLYPALYRMEKRGLLVSEWGISELERRAKFYRLTPRGRRRLETDTAEWIRFSEAVTAVLCPSAS